MSAQRPTPPWPSLYNFLIEIEPIHNRNPVQPKGRYLYDPTDIFRFTLYWTLIFYTPAFALCGTYVFLNIAFTPQSRARRLLLFTPRKGQPQSGLPLRTYKSAPESSSPTDSSALSPCETKYRHNERRSRLTFALLVAFMFAGCAVGGAAVGSAVLGYVIAGLFKAARFNMSTWIPFLMALMQSLIYLLGLWPTVIDIV